MDKWHAIAIVGAVLAISLGMGLNNLRQRTDMEICMDASSVAVPMEWRGGDCVKQSSN